MNLHFDPIILIIKKNAYVDMLMNNTIGCN